MKTRIAFYRGRKSQNPAARIGDRLICWVTGKPFSHCELVASLATLGGVDAPLVTTMTMGQMFVGMSSLIREQELLVSGA